MPDYRRYRGAGGTYFFTVNLLQRYPNDLLVRPIELLRTGVRDVRATWPFYIDAWVVLPDRLHCVWTLPPDDDDFTNRWRLIKQRFSKGLSNGERRSSVRIARGERGIGQRRFWEHAIRDEADYAAPVDYCHLNPVKQGFVQRAVDWPYSTLHRYLEQGIYPLDGLADQTSMFREAKEVDSQTSPMRRNTRVRYCALRGLESGLDFRQAHRLVGHLVRRHLVGGDLNQLKPDELAAAAVEVLGHRVEISAAALRAALGPRAAVSARAVPGGAAPSP